MEFSPQEMDRLNSNALYKTVGIIVKEAKDGEAHSILRPNPDMCWPFEGQPHGGILFTLMDTTMAWAVMTGIEREYTCATINFDIQYTRRAKGDFFTCRAWITHRANQIAYTRADIFDKEDQLVAAGQSSFRIIMAS